MQKVFIIIICICVGIDVVLFIRSRLEAKRAKTRSNEQGADSLARRAECNLDTAEQYNQRLATAIDDCKRASTTASELTARAKELNARAREICENSRKLLAETQDLLEDCSSTTSGE